jgi:glucosamine-6-phosphate deaminase
MSALDRLPSTLIAPDRDTMSRGAAHHAAGLIRQALDRHPTARVVAATGASQIDFLKHLTKTGGIDWSRVELFHLDEYVGLPASHPASFRRYLHEHLIAPTGIRLVHLLDVEAGVEAVRQRVGAALAARPADVTFAGIGENGHLAFNDPPADFTAADPYLVVQLDEACRRQQVGEGWFAGLDEVPRQAVSMSVRQILSSQEIISVVPDARKANAVRAALEGPIDPGVPASALRRHPRVTLYLDEAAAGQLAAQTRARLESAVR